MKSQLFALAFLAFAVAGFTQTKYTDPQGKFTAVFPNDVTAENDEIEVSWGKSTLYSFMAMDASQYIYMVSYGEYNGSKINDKNHRNQLMEDTSDGFFEELNITKQPGIKVKSKKYNGLEYRGQSSNYSVIYRVFIAKNYIFQIIVLGTKGYPGKNLSDDFFINVNITL